MRVFVKFYPIVDTITLDIEASANIKSFKERLCEHTNLQASDKLKVIVKNVPMTSDEVTLWDLEIKEDTTFHVVVQEQQNGPFKINVPHSLGSLTPLDDTALAHVLSFLTLSELIGGTSVTCRKLRTVENQKQEIVWKPLASQIMQQHVRDEHRVKFSEFMASTKKKINFKQLYLQRFFRAKVWAHVKKFSAVPVLTEEQRLANFEKEKAIKVKREPRPLTEEEEQFLQENDANALRRNLRKDKTAREKLRKHGVLEARKAEIESGVWKVVPQDFIQFDYETLMMHSFGLNPTNNEEGVTGVYDGQGRFQFFNKDGKLIILADIEPEDEFYRFKNILVDESDPSDPKDSIEKFFALFQQCKAKKIEEKKLLDIKISESGTKGFVGDAVTDILLVAKKYDAASAKVERPRVEAKKTKEETNELTTFQTTQFVFKPNSEEENDTVDKLNHDLVAEAYTAVLTAAHKEDIATLGTLVLENAMLKKTGRESDENSKSIIGRLLARGVTKFVTENTFMVGEATQDHAESTHDPEEASSAKKQKKALQKFVVLVKDEEELEIVRNGISVELDLH